jgi:hypothetical protein
VLSSSEHDSLVRSHDRIADTTESLDAIIDQTIQAGQRAESAAALLVMTSAGRAEDW